MDEANADSALGYQLTRLSRKKCVRMTTVHVEFIGSETVLPRDEFNRLLELARRTEEVMLESDQDEVPALGITWLAGRGGAFDWLDEGENLYAEDDLKVRYR